MSLNPHRTKIILTIRQKDISRTTISLIILTLFRMGFFGAAHGWVVAFLPPLPKIRHTNPTMMKLGTVIPYLRKIQKMYKSRDTPLGFCWHQHFFTGNQQMLLQQEIHIQIGFWCIISFFLTFLESLVIVLKYMVTILIMSSKVTTPGLLKVRVFWNNDYDVIIFVHDVTNKILSRDSNYSIDVVMWPKFGNWSISMRKVIITSIL